MQPSSDSAVAPAAAPSDAQTPAPVAPASAQTPQQPGQPAQPGALGGAGAARSTSEVPAILAVVFVAGLLGLFGGWALRLLPGQTSAKSVAVQSSGLPAGIQGESAGAAPGRADFGYVVINSDDIGADALKAMQQATTSNPALISHIGELGALVGKSLQESTKAYVAQGLIVYRADALLGYPAQNDRTAQVKAHVMQAVQAAIARWSQAGQSGTPGAPSIGGMPSGGSSAQPGTTGPGFEP